jgi:predicted AlkP superfamily pyrophosphatase or phosphodiesterase
MGDERWAALPSTGGFARLRREGLYARELRFAHAATDTAPGHSALYTGAVPRVSGIVANETIPAGGGDPVSFLLDPTTRIVAAGTGVVPSGKPSSSLVSLRVDTLADDLVRASPDAEIISLSLKDRGALLGGGRKPSAVIWLDPELGTFVTSTAFASAFPSWAAPLGDAAAVRAAMSAGWTLGDPAWVAAHAETPDDAPGESAYQGLGKTFPHPITSAKALRATPAGDALLFALADAAATRIASTGHPGLLAISLSSHDYVVHLFGPHSWEAWDELAKLDAALGVFLARLDQLFGVNGYAVMLTGDHGSNALPEASLGSPSPWCRARGAAGGGSAGGSAGEGTADHWERSCGPHHRLLPREVVPELEATLGGALGPERGPYLAGIADPFLFFTPRARALPPPDRETLTRVLTETLQQQFGLSHVVEVRSMPRTCPTFSAHSFDESWSTLVCRSVGPEGPGDLYLVVAPGSFVDPRLAPGAGTNHGSPYLYDRAVPLLVRAPGRVKAGVVRTRPIAFTAFARTAAALLDIPPPAAAAPGEDLTRR